MMKRDRRNSAGIKRRENNNKKDVIVVRKQNPSELTINDEMIFFILWIMLTDIQWQTVQANRIYKLIYINLSIAKKTRKKGETIVHWP